MTGVATVCALTFKLNVVVFVTPPPEAVTVMLEFPAAVELLVLLLALKSKLGCKKRLKKIPWPQKVALTLKRKPLDCFPKPT
jgi:hypothetical protein